MNFLALRTAALQCIAKSQRANGSFPSFTAHNALDFTHAVQQPAIFTTSLIINCLTECSNPECDAINTQASNYILSQLTNIGAVNYWQIESEQSTIMPYPDDLDDTACAYIALYKVANSIITGSRLAQLVKLLTAVEVEPGGPYRTWLVPSNSPDIWRDIDIVVNANIAYLAHILQIKLPALDKWLLKNIGLGQLHSPYYAGVLPVLFFVSRALPNNKTLLDTLQNLSITTPLDAALAICILLRSGGQPQQCEPYLSLLDTNWQAFGFAKEKEGYAGSAALTAAFIYEALALYEFSLQSPPVLANTTIAFSHIEIRLRQLSQPLRTQALQFLDEFSTHASTAAIPLLPPLFAQCLPPAIQQNSAQIADLSEALLWGWLTYTLTDDILDADKNVEWLPLASYMQRNLDLYFSKLIPAKYYRDTMDRMDAANAWELKHCRFIPEKSPMQLPKWGSLGRLADKSAGHTLAGTTQLLAAGLSPNSLAVKKIEQFFTHYAIARQLNDDAHDWEIDLQAGHLTWCNCQILQCNPAFLCAADFTLHLPEMRTLYWNSCIKPICERVLQHVELARKALAIHPVLISTAPLEALLLEPESAALRGLHQVKMLQDFNTEYLQSK